MQILRFAGRAVWLASSLYKRVPPIEEYWRAVDAVAGGPPGWEAGLEARLKGLQGGAASGNISEETHSPFLVVLEATQVEEPPGL